MIVQPSGKTAIWLLPISGLVVGVAVGLLYARLAWPSAAAHMVSPVDIHQLRELDLNPGAYKLINPLLGCEVSGPQAPPQLQPLKDKLLELVDAKVSQGDVSRASIYFDDRNGHSISINPPEKYFPASLLKVPIMVAVFKLAESNPSLLQKQITYDGSFDLNTIEFYKPQITLQPHTSYTVADLVERMVAYSDNNAAKLLLDKLSDQNFNDIFKDLGVTIPSQETSSLGDFITVGQYAGFFRVLYNATYLSRDMSERALELLLKPDFPPGLTAGVPGGVPVAQKFGERNFSNDPSDTTSAKELHDCGIIYAPGHPYLLCVMTKGTDFTKLASSIKDISAAVYAYVPNLTK